VLGRKSLLVFLGGALTSLLSFVALLFITNFIGAKAYGSVTLVFSILATIFVVADLGFSNAHVKRVSEGCDIDDCFSTYAIIKINLTCIFVIVSFLAMLVWMTFFGENITERTRLVFIVLVLYDVVSNLAGIVTTTFQGKSQMAKAQLISLSYPIARVPLVIIVAILGTDALGLSITYLIAMIVMFTLAVILIKKVKIKFVQPTLIRSYYCFAIPLVFSTIVLTLAANMDKILIGLSLGDTSVGYYFSAQSFVGIIAGIGTAVAALTFPDFSRLFKEKKIEEIKGKCKEAERFISILVLPIMVMMIVFPGEIMSILFGSDFSKVAEALRWLALGTLLIVLNQPYSSQILAANRSGLMAWMTIISYFAMILTMIILIPTHIGGLSLLGWGLLGAALSYFIYASIFMVLTRLSVRQISGTPFNLHIIVHLLCASIVGVFLSVLAIIFPVSSVVMLGVFLFFSLILFYLLMFLLKEFKGSDFRYILDMINPRRMSRYIADEISEKKE